MKTFLFSCLLLLAKPVSDDRGKSFLPIDLPDRLVSLAPSVTEMVVALGLDRALVGITLWDTALSPQGRVVVGSQGRTNVEEVLFLRPQAVLAAGITSPEEIKRMEGLGLKVFLLKTENLEGILDDLRKLGRFLGRERVAMRIADSLSSLADSLQRSVAKLPSKRVFLLLDTYGGLWTAGGGTFLDDLLMKAHGVNIFAELKGWKTVSPEALIVKNPDVIILGWGADPGVLKEPSFRKLKATREGKVIRVPDPDLLSRPGIHTVEALRWLISVLHRGSGEKE